VEVNISFAKKGEPLGTKVEVKNINSFKAVEGAIIYETKRHIEVLESGRTLVQETRGWDDVKRITVSQRKKENANDYRYFPEPDLPPFETAIFNIEKIAAEMPELPESKRERFVKEFGLTRQQTEALADDLVLADYYEKAASELAEREDMDDDSKMSRKKARLLLFNYLTSDMAGLLSARGETLSSGIMVTPENLAHLVDLIADGKIASRQAKDILNIMVARGGDPENIMKTEGLKYASFEKLKEIIKSLISEDEKNIGQLISKREATESLVGKTMAKLKENKLQSDPDQIRAIIFGSIAHLTQVISTEGKNENSENVINLGVESTTLRSIPGNVSGANIKNLRLPLGQKEKTSVLLP
jgi:aspartyl-tRNA(Asn)/glutamyl-tRNA(Gln) amidotransferase subunit B